MINCQSSIINCCVAVRFDCFVEAEQRVIQLDK
jgi:hypothetical protein